jgi:hypothetical protein
MKRFFSILIILFVSAAFVFAQGEDGSLKRKSAKPTPKTDNQTKKKTNQTKSSPNTTKKSSKTPLKSKPKSKPQSSKTIYATLNITVNAPESEIFLSNSEGNVFEGQDSAWTDASGVLEIEEVPAGTYTLSVRKNGFYGEDRKISVAGGRVNTVSVLLRPSGAFLSVSTDVEGASIEIENFGEFQNSVENLLVNPGTYRVSVYKNGYLSETKSVSLNAAGQKQQVSFVLNPLPLPSLLLSAEKALQNGDWNGALRGAKKILAAEPDNARANLIAGLACFQGANPPDGVYLLTRAIVLGETVSVPARVFNKEKGNLQLIGGNLIFGKDTLAFVGSSRPDLNFRTSQPLFTELFEKFDEFGVKHISIKARGDFNGKNDRRTVRIYPQQAAVTATRKDLMCPACSGNVCPCQAEGTALYDLINRWRSRRLADMETNFAAVVFPSDDFASFETPKFSIKLPENWQILARSEARVFAAPPGGYSRLAAANSYQYSHGIDAAVRENPNRFDAVQASRNTVRDLLTNNSYLKQERTFGAAFAGVNFTVTVLRGVSPVSKRGELVNLYTTVTPNGDVFYLTTIVPPDESADYEAAFRRILNSIKFR